jgi:hypothetical protein
MASTVIQLGFIGMSAKLLTQKNVINPTLQQGLFKGILSELRMKS